MQKHESKFPAQSVLLFGNVTGIACVFDGAAGMINAGRELGSGFPAQGDRV